jgi:hypothetical protein
LSVEADRRRRKAGFGLAGQLVGSASQPTSAGCRAVAPQSGAKADD